MIVHLFPQEKFTVPFIKFINENFDNNEHMFLIYGKSKSYKVKEVEKYNNIVYINKDNKKNLYRFLKYTNKAEKIICHSLFWSIWIKLYFLFNKKLLKKANWVIWGGDLYLYKYRKINLKSDINEFIRKIIIKNMSGLITHIKGDYELARKWYDAKGQYIYCFMYPSNLFNEFKLDKKNDEDKIYIQIGNSADPSNKHLEIFKKIKSFSKQNIKIICPLSYGDENYKKLVVQEGKKLFNDKFEPLLEFMELDIYIEILSKINIAIFNHKRQQAVGNITTLLGMGKKVYIRSDITTWDFCKEHNLKVFDTLNELDKLLDELDEKTKISNINSVKKNFSKDKLIDDYKRIFND